MRQPEPMSTIEELREFLRFAVPMRAATLLADYSPHELEMFLPGMARRAGGALGPYGDALQFSDGRPRVGRARDRVIRTADDLVTGIAAAALLAGPGGVTVFGDHYRPARSSDYAHPQCHATSRFDHAEDTPPGADVPPIPGPRPLADVIRDLTDYQPT